MNTTSEAPYVSPFFDSAMVVPRRQDIEQDDSPLQNKVGAWVLGEGSFTFTFRQEHESIL